MDMAGAHCYWHNFHWRTNSDYLFSIIKQNNVKERSAESNFESEAKKWTPRNDDLAHSLACSGAQRTGLESKEEKNSAGEIEPQGLAGCRMKNQLERKEGSSWERGGGGHCWRPTTTKSMCGYVYVRVDFCVQKKRQQRKDGRVVWTWYGYRPKKKGV